MQGPRRKPRPFSFLDGDDMSAEANALATEEGGAFANGRSGVPLPPNEKSRAGMAGRLNSWAWNPSSPSSGACVRR